MSACLKGQQTVAQRYNQFPMYSSWLFHYNTPVCFARAPCVCFQAVSATWAAATGSNVPQS